MKKALLCCTLYAIIIYLTGATLNPAITASQPVGGNEIHYCGVIDGQLDKQHSDQFPNRHYARTLATNLNVGEPYTVRIIYFLPNDRTPEQDINTKLDTLIKNVQKFYADEMERHGFGRKTFTFETDTGGNALVHHVDGQFASSYYSGSLHPSEVHNKVWSEIADRFDRSKNIYLVAEDSGRYGGGVGGVNDSGGSVTISINRERFDTPTYLSLRELGYLTAHELGHTFGLKHDFRNPVYIMAYRSDLSSPRLSRCAAEWLDADRYFNANQTSFNEPLVIQMFPPLVSPPNAIRLRFEVTDADGLHQAHLLIPSTITDPAPGFKLQSCKSLNGQSDTIEFITTELTTKNNEILLNAIDVHGNWTSQGFSIDTTLLPAEVVVSIPDANLAAAVRQALGLAPSDAITQLGMLELTRLKANFEKIADLTGLEHAIHLIWLEIPILQIIDLSPLAHLTNLTYLSLENTPSDISALSGLANLTYLRLVSNSLSDISPLAGLTNLGALRLWNTSISDISPVSGLTTLTDLFLGYSNVSDISPVAGLTNLTKLYLRGNSISDISPLIANTGLGSGDTVDIQENPLSYQSIHAHILTLQSRGVTVEFDNRTPTPPLKISGDNQQEIPGTILKYPFVVEVRDQNGEVFAGVPVTFTVTTGGGTLSVTSTTTDENGRAESTLTLGSDAGMNIVSVSTTGIQQTVTFSAAAEIEFDLSMPSGISLIHVPLKVTAVDGAAKTITSIADLYDALGGASSVNFLITYDSQTQEWLSYFVPSDKGTPADRRLTDDLGIIAGMKSPTSVRLKGDALGTDGSSTIALSQGLNLVALPLNNSRINRVSDLFALDGIGGNVPVIILTDDGEFKLVGRADDPGDIEITGGQSFILTAQRAAIVEISGEAWTNVAGTSAAPQGALTGIEVGDTTPVLALRGSIVDEGTGVSKAGFRVKVKNLSTDRALSTVTGDEGNSYQLTVVDIETGRAATVGDILEVSVQSPNPFIGVKPLRYTVTAEDVKRGLTQLPELVAYEIPAETELLRNYPNPFNPETWIPYRLAEDAFVSLTIYNRVGQIVRTFDVGHQTAAVYENRSKAVYWDGRNGLGEQVASGVYFYHLSAGDFSATRKMLILK